MATNETKLVNLGQLKELASRVVAEDTALSGRIDAVVSDVEELVAVGAQANVLEGVKVNGTALTIAEKMVDILIEAGSENGTISVNGANVAVTGLQALAYKAKISEADMDDALKAVITAKATNADLQAEIARAKAAEEANAAAAAAAQGAADKAQSEVDAAEERITALENAGFQNAEQVSSAIASAISASGHAHFEKVDAVPTAANAQENVLYLVMNTTTGHYDIYALVSGKVELIDDTTVDLSNYSTTAQMQAAIQAAIEGLSIGDYATLEQLNAALDRITVVENKFANYYTKDEAEAKFTDETEAQTIAESAIGAATATDEEVSSMLDETFGS